MAIPLSLDVYRGDDLVTSQSFDRDIIKIGRLSSAHLRLEDEKVSRIHSVVEVDPAGQVSIIDMGSSVGTLVNGQRVNKGPLRHGDEIRLGDTRVVVRIEAPAEEAPAPAAPTPVPEAPVSQAPTAPDPVAPAPAAPASSDPAAEAPVAAAAAPAPRSAARPGTGRRAAGAWATGGAIPEPTFGRGGDVLSPYDGRDFVSEKVEPASIPDADHRAVEVRLNWGRLTIKAEHFVKAKKITIGESKKATLFLHADDFPGHEYPLVRWDGADYVLSFTPQMKGLVRLGGEVHTLKELIHTKKAVPGSLDDSYELPLPADARAALVFGGATVLISFVSPPQRIVAPFSENIDFSFLNTLLVTLFLHVAMLVTAYSYPLNTDLISDDLFKSPNRFAKIILEAPKPVENRFTRRHAESLKKVDPGEAAAAHKGEEGKMGRKKAPDRKTRSAPKAIDINAKDLIANQGVFKMLENGGSAGISTVFGKGGLGGDIKGAVGGLVGASVGDARGTGGLGLKGSGTGGGGLSGTTIGVGGINTKGRGGGVGTYGSNVAGLGSKRESDISIDSSDAVVMGSLDKELIAKVIRSHRSQIRYCYEKELQRSPGLYGKVTVKFTIAADGHVSAASMAGNTMDSAAVGSCLIGRVRSWKFPKPKGGGIVIVTYPFVFKPGG